VRNGPKCSRLPVKQVSLAMNVTQQWSACSIPDLHLRAARIVTARWAETHGLASVFEPGFFIIIAAVLF